MRCIEGRKTVKWYRNPTTLTFEIYNWCRFTIKIYENTFCHRALNIFAFAAQQRCGFFQIAQKHALFGNIKKTPQLMVSSISRALCHYEKTDRIGCLWWLWDGCLWSSLARSFMKDHWSFIMATGTCGKLPSVLKFSSWIKSSTYSIQKTASKLKIQLCIICRIPMGTYDFYDSLVILLTSMPLVSRNCTMSQIQDWVQIINSRLS